MVRDAAPAGEADPARLFTPPARWGYEYVEPPPTAQSPESDNPPSRRQARRIPRAQAVGLREAAILVTVGAVGVLILDSELGVLSAGGANGSQVGAVVIVHLAAAAIAFWAARAWQRSSPKGESTGRTSVVQRHLVSGVNALVTLIVPYIVLPIEAVVAWRRIWQGRHDLVPDPGDTRRAEAEYQEATAAWQEQVARFEAAEVKRFESVDLWYPVPLSPTARMVCVFGGAPISWTAVLATLGASLLGDGARIVIGDLSRHLTADVLCDLCRTVGVPATEAVLPGGAISVDLFADVSWKDLSSVLVEVLHSAQRDLAVSHQERHEDRSVILDVVECLDSDGPVSIARLRTALLVIQGAAGVGNGDGAVIGVEERDRLSGVFNEVQRQHGGVMERVTRIERALRDFEMLDGAGQRHDGDGDGAAPVEPPSVAGGGHGELRIIGVDRQTDDLEHDRLVDLLFQLLLRRVRRGWAQADVLVILGADRIRRDALESLMTHAEQEHIEVLLFFEHFRQDAVEVVGGGGAAAVFLALGNHHEAREASDFIGGEYKWVESLRTASAGESLTGTRGKQDSTSFSGTVGFPFAVSAGVSKTKGRSFSETFGESREYAVDEQRVHEAVIEPEVLRGLPVTGMICVEVLPGGGQIATNVDCHPLIAFAPRVAGEPRRSTPAR